MRQVWPDIWVESWKGFISGLPEGLIYIVPDVRFPNEVKAIQDMGGIVIRLTRNPEESNDETETALDSWEYNKDKEQIGLFDYDVNNAEMTIDETNQACLKIATDYLDIPRIKSFEESRND